jgi:ABC-type branched-subunit amino acid transport system permease subunit
VAIRENQQRATFQGYHVDRYRLGVFVLSAVVTGLGGALLGFLNYLVSAEAVSVPLSGELLAMVVIGGMHSILGPALGVVFYILFRSHPRSKRPASRERLSRLNSLSKIPQPAIL